jgi:pimeloyl-ACP methyl ester carboxylesterase
MIGLAAVRLGFALGSQFAPHKTAERAARLFATPFRSSRARARAVQADADMRRETVRVQGEVIATYVWGDPVRQPYVLLAHGWSSFGLRFLKWVPQLRALGFAVVAFDQPGHGASGGTLATLPEFALTAHAVGEHYGNAALAIGHSLGGAAVTLALDETWRAQKLILIAPAADMVAAAGRFFRFVRLSARLRKQFFAWHERRTGVDPSSLQIHRIASALGQQTLVVHDVEDRDVPWDEGERYARHLSNARLLTTTGLGHNRIVDDADVMAAAMLFLCGETVGERVVSSQNLPFGFA